MCKEEGMTSFEEYGEFVNGMKIYPKHFAIIYPALGLTGEAGEIAEKVKKVLRDNEGEWTDAAKAAVLDELGDPLWYIAALADDLGYTLQDVIDNNVSKLTSRKSRGVLKGSGDAR